ncbi:hypothetical protein EVAR_31280_1 [Eumeta japonica]|uniref:Uncharacterized protein n=1 Tax=Eumeta variegata TaxID=151549 RepID=A0A4C1VTL8_EUMVA|nr:hypothetical protein EVAR_31280_1 [Eumeta japonica]
MKFSVMAHRRLSYSVVNFTYCITSSAQFDSIMMSPRSSVQVRAENSRPALKRKVGVWSLRGDRANKRELRLRWGEMRSLYSPNEFRYGKQNETPDF